jgi:hypothetical protein
MRSLAQRFRGICDLHKLFGFRRQRRFVISAVVVGCTTLAMIAAVNGQQLSQFSFRNFILNGVFFPNANGASQTYSTNGGGIDLTNPFFQSLGTNGRTCGTCHQPSDGMSVSAANVELRFLLTQGTDPVFRPVDGSNCNHNIDVSTVKGRYAAYSLLRTRGLIRIALSIPANADYAVTSVNNPYGCSSPFLFSVLAETRECYGTSSIFRDSALPGHRHHACVEVETDRAFSWGVDRANDQSCTRAGENSSEVEAAA